jgi:hypothetical protein
MALLVSRIKTSKYWHNNHFYLRPPLSGFLDIFASSMCMSVNICFFYEVGLSDQCPQPLSHEGKTMTYLGFEPGTFGCQVGNATNWTIEVVKTAYPEFWNLTSLRYPSISHTNSKFWGSLPWFAIWEKFTRAVYLCIRCRRSHRKTLAPLCLNLNPWS